MRFWIKHKDVWALSKVVKITNWADIIYTDTSHNKWYLWCGENLEKVMKYKSVTCQTQNEYKNVW